MIQFFRKLRQNLIAEGKTGRYFKYARGEIVLVVIGILIALQINNWNQGRLALDRERVTLSNLNSEFRDNLEDLDSINNILLRAIDANELIFNMIRAESVEHSVNIDSLLTRAITSPSWKPSEFVLNELKNSDGLAKLNDNDLKRQLFQWSRFFNELQETMAQLEDTNKDLILFIRENGSLRNVDVESELFKYRRSQLGIENAKLLQNFKFENIIDDKLYVLIEAKNDYARAKVLIEEILQSTSTE